MRNRMYGGVRGRKTKVGRKLLRFPPTRLLTQVSQAKGVIGSYSPTDATEYHRFFLLITDLSEFTEAAPLRLI